MWLERVLACAAGVVLVCTAAGWRRWLVWDSAGVVGVGLRSAPLPTLVPTPHPRSHVQHAIPMLRLPLPSLRPGRWRLWGPRRGLRPRPWRRLRPRCVVMGLLRWWGAMRCHLALHLHACMHALQVAGAQARPLLQLRGSACTLWPGNSLPRTALPCHSVSSPPPPGPRLPPPLGCLLITHGFCAQMLARLLALNPVPALAPALQAAVGWVPVLAWPSAPSPVWRVACC